ncbi:hypothetical protein PFISCL1PPCAC_25678, partial [Pristionchus fissidentatus]
ATMPCDSSANAEQCKVEQDLKRPAPVEQQENYARDPSDGEPEAKRLCDHANPPSSVLPIESGSSCRDGGGETASGGGDMHECRVPSDVVAALEAVVEGVVDEKAHECGVASDVVAALEALECSVPSEVVAALEALVAGVVDEEEFIDPCPDYDYDAENRNDPYSVADFAYDIFAYGRSREKWFAVGDYMPRHPGLKVNTHANVVEWLVDCQEAMSLNHESLYLGVKLFDLYLDAEKDPVPRSEIQLLAIVCLCLACKYEESAPVMVDDMLSLWGEDAPLDAEAALQQKHLHVLQTLDYDLGAPNSYAFLRRYAKAYKTDMNSLTLARYILETSLYYYEYVGASASRIAAGAFLLALRMEKAGAEWTPAMHKYSGHAASLVEPWAAELNHMMHVNRSDIGINPKLKTVRGKYANEAYFKVGKVPLLPDAFPIDRPLTRPN